MFRRLLQRIQVLLEGQLKRCPKTGCIVGLRPSAPGAKWIQPLLVLLLTLWIFARVLPKPSRAHYPCQRASISLVTAWLIATAVGLGSHGFILFLRKQGIRPGLILLAVSAFVFAVQSRWTEGAERSSELAGTYAVANAPIGQSFGIYPGRVVWAQDFSSTRWNGSDGYWWEWSNIDQAAVDNMLAKSIRALGGSTDPSEAWDNLFRSFNRRAGKGDVGYQSGEQIVVKLNLNATGNPRASIHNKGYHSPHLLDAFIRQLIEEAGVRGRDIVLCDPSRCFNPVLITALRRNASSEYQQIHYIQCEDDSEDPYIRVAEADLENPIHFKLPDNSRVTLYFPTVFAEADYMINFSLVRPHSVFAMTSAAKNHFGSVWDVERDRFKPTALHAFALRSVTSDPNQMGYPHSTPSILGHASTGGKTMLYLADGLYTSLDQSSDVVRFSTMGDRWLSSILAAQDPIALESVILDLISSEPNLVSDNPCFNGHEANALVEAALADDPPSGVTYDPEDDGTPLCSLGVFEHWNNATERQYSRNLGTGAGIELVHLDMASYRPHQEWLALNRLSCSTDMNTCRPGDALPLLAHYALDLPLGGAVLPKPDLHENCLEWSFFGGREDIFYTVETSQDLLVWSTDGVELSTPDASGQRTAEITAPSGSSFLRLALALAESE
jgi:uncharacterized protein (DUF362 family)